MTGQRDLLVEIGTEELPPRALDRLARAFANGVENGLREAGLAPAQTHRYATPRRLAVIAAGVPLQQAERVVERWGPPLGQAFDAEGNPTKAALGFAAAAGASVEALEQVDSPKGKRLYYRWTEPGRAAADLIPEVVAAALDSLPVPKRMRWGAGEVSFVRPVHWAVVLYGDEVLAATPLGVEAGRTTRGHRFHHPEPIELGSPAEYAARLEREGRVIADLERRRATIAEQVAAAAREVGGEAVMPPGLLEEVTGLVEWPVALVGGFDARFLELPREVLISTMTGHQRYFPVRRGGGEGALLPHFVVVANIESGDPEQVRHGNERVIRPRLADAAFFWEQDRKRPLSERLEGLKSMVFQERLGTLLDKTERVTALAGRIADTLAAEPPHVRRAARLAKCDLLTQMVEEFPDLQGTMGYYYALADGEPEAVARAIYEHYLPRFAGDRVAQTPAGQVLAIADRLDTVVGIFAAGEPPTGDKDPFGVRRAGLGVLRTVIERGLGLDLWEALEAAAAGFPADLGADALVEPVFDFMMERLRAHYLDDGVEADVFEAVLARHPTRPCDFERRVRAVGRFRARPEAESLAAANKRIRNILRQAEAAPARFDPERLGEPAERALARRLAEVEAEARPLVAQGDFAQALEVLAGLRDPVDAFFDEVMVLAEDRALRENRLALLARLQRLFLQVADVSRLQLKGHE